MTTTYRLTVTGEGREVYEFDAEDGLSMEEAWRVAYENGLTPIVTEISSAEVVDMETEEHDDE